MKNIFKNLKTDQTFLVSSTVSWVLVILSIILIKYNYTNLPSFVPLWFSKSWGDNQLAPKIYIYIFPILQVVLGTINAFIINYLLNKNKKEYSNIFCWLNIFNGLLQIIFMLRIINQLTYFPFNVISPRFFNLCIPFASAFAVSYFSTPLVIKIAHRFNVITDPNKDKHPAMLIKTPIPRLGALAFYFGFIICGLIFLPIGSKKIIGIYIGTTLAVILGILDDKYKDINRYVRLLFMFAIAGITALFGVVTFYLNNPFDTALKLDFWVLKMQAFGGEHKLFPIAFIFSVLWIIWVMNTLSWSNGIDGQFSGISGITALVIVLLSLRFVPVEESNFNIAVLAAITSGAAFGLAPRTWYPQKILWGFGATAVGLVIASLSILSVSKVAAASLVLLVPFLDAVAAFIRRVARKQSPLFGDREHLHHKLLNMGWSIPQVSLLYWILCLLFGTLALVSSGADTILTALTFGGIVGFILILFNLNLIKDMHKQRKQ